MLLRNHNGEKNGDLGIQLTPSQIDFLLKKIETRGIKNRDFGYFGSFTWSGVAVKKLAAFAQLMNWDTIDFTVEEKMGLKENNYQLCISLGKKMAEMLRKEQKQFSVTK